MFELPRSCSLIDILNSIATERSREATLSADGSRLQPAESRASFWSNLFRRTFAESVANVNGAKDDLLFYVRKVVPLQEPTNLLTSVEVYRKCSQKLPHPRDSSIDWEETLYLNTILQQFEYTVTCAVCTRTGLKELQILRKISQPVYASPSRHRMDAKGSNEVITYPLVCFTIDNFESLFRECVIRDSEVLCIELVARDRAQTGLCNSTVFLGSIRYEALREVCDSRASFRNRLAFRAANSEVEFVKMRGPHGKGHAEIAVYQLSESSERSVNSSEIGVVYQEVVEERAGAACDSVVEKDSQRRAGGVGSFFNRLMGDNSSSIFWNGQSSQGGFRIRNSVEKGALLGRATETTPHLRDDDSSLPCVESHNVEDELKDRSSGFSILGTSIDASGLGFGQAWHWFKERRRQSSIALRASLTCISIPWHFIVADVLDSSQEPVITF